MKAGRAQAASEYMMTYGWALLVVAIVLASLFFLGVFNSNLLTPRAQPSSCSVLRPLGPGTSTGMSVQGVCNNEAPKFVAQFSGTSYVSANIPYLDYGSSPITITAWIYPTSTTGQLTAFSTGQSGADSNLYFALQSGLLQVSDGAQSLGSVPATPNTWYFVAATFDGSSLTGYVYTSTTNSSATAASSLDLPAGPLFIGALADGASPNCCYFNGSIANVQVYDFALTGSDLQALRLEGIGGEPIDISNLVAWYPLNENATDYSGNRDNGAAVNVGFTASYTPP